MTPAQIIASVVPDVTLRRWLSQLDVRCNKRIPETVAAVILYHGHPEALKRRLDLHYPELAPLMVR